MEAGLQGNNLIWREGRIIPQPPQTIPLSKNSSCLTGGNDNPSTVILDKSASDKNTLSDSLNKSASVSLDKSTSRKKNLNKNISDNNGPGKKKKVKAGNPIPDKKQQEERNIQITPVFMKLKMTSNSRIVLSRGGAGSSKSHSVYQLMVERLFGVGPRKILILRKTLPSLRASVKPKIDEILHSYKLDRYVKEEKVEMNYRYGRNLLHFGSLFADPERIKSTEWNDILLEEATEFDHADYKQLLLRLRASVPRGGTRNQIHLAFNPINEIHWIKTELLDKQTGDLAEIISTYKDNPYLDKDYVDYVEGLAAQDPNFHRIYTLGEWGSLENIIYRKWDVVDKVPEEVRAGIGEIYAVDFGFSSPTCVARIWADPTIMEAWLEIVLYKPGYTNRDLIDKVLDKKIPTENRKRYPIYADTQEPARIKEINDNGFKCLPSDKSVSDGIDYCKRWKLHILDNSPDGVKEISGYSYREDSNGHVLEEPVKFNDHFCDTFRYGLYTKYGKKGARPQIRTM
jgi:phage terminase large subunit